jgi:hypothetical protein
LQLELTGTLTVYQTCQGSRISRESYTFCFCPRCPARISKMILKLHIFTIIWHYPTFRTITHWHYAVWKRVELELIIDQPNKDVQTHRGLGYIAKYAFWRSGDPKFPK